MESNLAEQIESLRSGIQSLSSTVERIAKEQVLVPARTTEALNDAEEVVARNPLAVSPSRWVWDF
jgi:hypothetical protein